MILHNIRSTYNVGSIFRTADGFGVQRLLLSGYTPYPAIPEDTRLPHIRNKTSSQIHKTALGAELAVSFDYQPAPDLMQLRQAGYTIVALEQTVTATPLPEYRPAEKVALLLGEEVNGIDPNLLKLCDEHVEIPMKGSKESFNVSVACGIALYALRFSQNL